MPLAKRQTKDSEHIENILPTFRGVNDKRVRPDDIRQLLVDTLDASLYGQIEPGELGVEKPLNVKSNKEFCAEGLRGDLGQGSRVCLKDFYVLEWIPYSPGRFFTQEAMESRRKALEWFSHERQEYFPVNSQRHSSGVPVSLGGTSFELADSLKASVHSDSDKFSLYPIINRLIATWSHLPVTIAISANCCTSVSRLRAGHC
jgi:hypothetical protein